MSGPKYSQMELDQMRQRQLELERQRRLEEEKRKRQLQRSIESGKTELRKLIETLNQTFEGLIQQAEANKLEDRVLYRELTSQKEKTAEKIQAFSLSYDQNSIPNMEKQLQVLMQFQNDLEADDKKKLDQLAGQLEGELGLKENFEARQQMLDELSRETVSEKKRFDIQGLSGSRGKPVEAATINIKKEAEKAYEELKPFLQDPAAYFYSETVKLYESIRSIAENEVFDHAYKKSQIDLRMSTFQMNRSKYIDVLDRLSRERAAHEELLLQYQSLCGLLGLAENPLFSTIEPQNKEALKAEVERLDQEYAEKQETAYIVQSVHEVMENLGYDILATDYMVRKKQNVHHHIYELGFEQAVNVFVSDNGSILFEVTGIGEGQSEMTSLEKLKVTEAMDAFCTNYVEIRDELKKKGIHLKNESLSPADERYARKVDISNKNMVKQRSQTSAAASRKRNQSAPRHLN